MDLYILRHGLAGESGTYKNDSQRPLTPKGKRKLKAVSRAMAELELDFDQIVSSPYARARQTAELVANALKASKKLRLSETLTPEGSSKHLIEMLQNMKPTPEVVMLVGHEPYLSRLISLLVTGNSSSRVVLKKGGLCKLSIESLKHGQCAGLEWLLTPKQM